MTQNILLCGVGGQGTVLASKLIAYAALLKGFDAKTTDTIGMAQRGGSVVSHVRIGNDIHSPIIPFSSADLIIAFEPAEAVRALPYLKENGTVIVHKKAVKPVTASLAETTYDGTEMLDHLKKTVDRLYAVDLSDIAKACGTEKVINTALLGAACSSGGLLFSLDEMENAIKSNVKERFWDINIKALHLGAELTK